MSDYYDNSDPFVQNASRVAWGVGLTAVGLTAVGEFVRGDVSWASAGIILGTGAAAGGIAFVVSYVIQKVTPIIYPELLFHAENVSKMWAELERVRALSRRVAELEARQSVQPAPQRVTAVAQPVYQSAVIEDDYDEGDEGLEPWRELLYGRLVNNMLQVGATSKPIPDWMRIEWIEQLAEARWEGELDGTVSSRKLDGVGISRNGNGSSPASLTMKFLEETGAVISTGENQPCRWTSIGQKTFPTSPTLSEPG